MQLNNLCNFTQLNMKNVNKILPKINLCENKLFNHNIATNTSNKFLFRSNKFNFCGKIENKNEKLNNIPDLRHFLTDNFNRVHNYLRISLTERCNLRCQYCMPEEGIDLTENKKLLTNQELFKLLDLFTKAGVQKIRLTGGEPLIRKDIVDIVKGIKSYPDIKSIAMTTNGIVLKHKLKYLKEAGLDTLNISLDTFVEGKFELLTRRLGFKRVLESIDHALELGFSTVKINCVMMKGINDEEILDFVEFTKDKDVYVRFIEFMPFDGNLWNIKKLVPLEEMLQKIKQKYEFVKIDDKPNDTSKGYKVPGYKGKVGFISSMTDHFCGTCNRIRLTADGNLKVCLFSNKEVSLRDMLRQNKSDDEIYSVIEQFVKGKKFSHDGMLNLAERKNRPMITIGG